MFSRDAKVKTRPRTHGTFPGVATPSMRITDSVLIGITQGYVNLGFRGALSATTVKQQKGKQIPVLERSPQEREEWGVGEGKDTDSKPKYIKLLMNQPYKRQWHQNIRRVWYKTGSRL